MNSIACILFNNKINMIYVYTDSRTIFSDILPTLTLFCDVASFTIYILIRVLILRARHKFSSVSIISIRACYIENYIY